MTQFIRTTFRRIASAVTSRLINWLARIGSAQDPPQRSAFANPIALIGENQNEVAEDISPEVQLAAAALPPIGKVKRRKIVPISEAGEIPELVEEIRLTSLGKIVARTEFLTMDGNNSVGHASQVKGQCAVCGRFSFQGQPCVCGRFICPACAVPFEDHETVVRLCPDCARSANWSKDTWK